MITDTTLHTMFDIYQLSVIACALIKVVVVTFVPNEKLGVTNTIKWIALSLVPVVNTLVVGAVLYAFWVGMTSSIRKGEKR